MKSLAAEWILYTHYTVKHFSVGHAPSSSSTDPLERDSALIYDKIRWQNPGDTQSRDRLPDPGERLPELTYWEIGNEPNYALAGLSLNPDLYLARYGVVNGSQVVDGITNHMIARDKSIHDGRQTIKVGPALMSPEKSEGFFPYVDELSTNGAEVNFISYHPYNRIFGTWASKKITLSTSCYKIPASTPYIYRNYTYSSTSELPDKASDWTGSHIAYLQRNIRYIQLYQYNWANSAKDSSSGAELLATEWNPGDSWSSFNLTWRSKSMAHALASMESVFSFARSGVT